jgi:hypothetical protein
MRLPFAHPSIRREVQQFPFSVTASAEPDSPAYLRETVVDIVRKTLCKMHHSAKESAEP